MATQILGTLRHACTCCGGSCNGVHIRVVGEEERDRILGYATELSIDDPMDERQVLRLVDGRCCFQDPETELCRIHAAHGLEAKPHLCRQYPLVATKVESGDVRVGVDPGCYASFLSWRSGPEVEAIQLMTGGVLYEGDGHQRQEEDVLQLLEAEGMSVAAALGLLTGTRSQGGALPAGLDERIVQAVQAMDLPGLVALPDAGPAMRRAMRPLARAAPSWERPPPWPALSPEAEAWALEATRRLIWLRLNRNLPSAPVTALLALVGAVAAGWVARDDAHFGATYAGWLRGLRAPAFLRALLPEPAALEWLAHGRG